MNTLAAIMGVTDVDPFIMGLTQAAGALTPLKIAAGAVLIAAASNNLVKGIYAYSLAGRKTGLQSLLLMIRWPWPASSLCSGSGSDRPSYSCSSGCSPMLVSPADFFSSYFFTQASQLLPAAVSRPVKAQRRRCLHRRCRASVDSPAAALRT